MTTHPSQPAGLTQCEIILARLSQTPGQWVPMPALARLAGAYAVHSRVADLRLLGHRIDHQNQRSGRKIHSFYRLASAPEKNLQSA